MDRRTFLRMGASALPVMVVRIGAPVIPAAALAPLANPTSVSAQPWLPVVGYLAKFALDTLSPALARKVDEWLNGKDSTERAQVESVNRNVGARGFDQNSSTSVYGAPASGVAYYGLPHLNGFNAFAPFFNSSGLATLAEGPTIVGLSLAAGDWPRTAAVPAADALVPIAAYDMTPWGLYAKPPSLSSGIPFDQTWPNPVVYQTRAGGVAMHYEADPQYQRGYLRVEVLNPYGQTWMQKGYPVAWI